MKILRVLKIECDSCDKFIRNIDVPLNKVNSELKKSHYCNVCNTILNYSVKKAGL